MKKSVSKHDFIEAFNTMDRADNFSINGRIALYDYLIQVEEDTNETFELDIIAICCEYSEYNTLVDCLDDYNLLNINQLEDKTTVIKFDGGIIIRSF